MTEPTAIAIIAVVWMLIVCAAVWLLFLPEGPEDMDL